MQLAPTPLFFFFFLTSLGNSEHVPFPDTQHCSFHVCIFDWSIRRLLCQRIQKSFQNQGMCLDSLLECYRIWLEHVRRLELVLFWSPTLSPWAKAFPPCMCQPYRVSSFLLGFGRAMLMHLKVSHHPLFLKWHMSLNIGTDTESWSCRCSSKNPATNCVKCSVLHVPRRDMQESPGICDCGFSRSRGIRLFL